MEHIVFVEATVTGAGLRAMQSARERGLFISFLTRKRGSYQPKDPQDLNLITLADQVLDVETNDLESVCQAVQNLHRQTPVTAVTTVADFYVPQAAAAAERLGLPTIPYEAAMNCRNKYRMRAALEQGDPTLNPAWALVNSEDEALEAAGRIGFPLIMKPQDENDSFDVKLIRTHDLLLAHFRHIVGKNANRAGQAKAGGGVLLESFMQGQEYSVETLIAGPGEPLQLIGVTRKYLTGADRDCFVEIGHCFPVEEHRDLIVAAVGKALQALGVHTAICHTEVKYLDGGIKIVEVNPRLAGGRIGSHLVEIATGVNPVDLAVDCARGLKPKWTGTVRQGAAIYNIPAPATGRITAVPDTTHFQHPDVIRYSLPLQAGQEVRLPLLNADLLGHVITRGATPDQALAVARTLAQRTRIDIG